ncbi:hypothetical protein F0358_10560 [Empedobacter brevis]|uniref:hypothetical protein n=1 Tax=Empedobacter brevis TaxID=247 RepID=UPI00123CCB3B|nr:hypothetical protein [Empedobacter brevis]QES93116.1 hypothetical protein F0358_10560 [Empedobacter brevis]
MSELKFNNLDEILDEIEKRGLTAYKISQETGLTEAGLGKILNRITKKPTKTTLNILNSYLTNFYYTESTEQMKGEVTINNENTVDILSNKNGNTYYIYEDNSIEIEVTFFPFSAYASYVEAYFDETFIEKEFSTTRFKVDHVGKGFYLGFKTANESMNGGGLNDTPGGAEILGREIGRHLWDSFRHEKYGYILMTKKNIFHKDIIDYNKDTGKLLLHSRNPEEKDFEIDINDVYRIFNVIKRSF